MRIYKELEALGFYKWYCTQYGGLNYQEYKSVYDDLPLDNLIRTELNACVFKFFREKYSLVHEISWSKYKGGSEFDYDIFSLVLPTDDELGDEDDIASDKSMETYDILVEKDFKHKSSETYEEAELECLKKLIEIVKNK
jgi:hypothetical protein